MEMTTFPLSYISVNFKNLLINNKINEKCMKYEYLRFHKSYWSYGSK